MTGITPLNRVLALAPVVLLPACGSLFGVGDRVELGHISASASNPPSLSAPDTVGANHPFFVTVTTGGPNGCWRADETRISLKDQRVTITPYDRVVNKVCTQATVEIAHTVRLVLSTPGTATVVAHGRAAGQGGAEIDIAKAVVVIPSITP